MLIYRSLYRAAATFAVLGLIGCSDSTTLPAKSFVASETLPAESQVDLSTVIKKVQVAPAYLSGFYPQLSKAALERTRHQVIYDGSYQEIAYPGGDVAPDRGVCTDVVIRSYRRLGIDLQKQVYEDRRYRPDIYPDLSQKNIKPNSSIDHRRVRNLRPFFEKNGLSLPVTSNPKHYRPGDIVTWKLTTGMDHIGIVVDRRSHQDTARFMVVHNIGEGPKLEDALFRYPIDGHYRYFGDQVL